MEFFDEQRERSSFQEAAERKAAARREGLVPAIEVNRAVVGSRVLIAERVPGARDAWRIRIEGSPDVVEWAERGPMEHAFTSLAATEPQALELWLQTRSSRAR